MWIKHTFLCACGRKFTVKRRQGHTKQHEICTDCLKLADRVPWTGRVVPVDEEPSYAAG